MYFTERSRNISRDLWKPPDKELVEKGIFRRELREDVTSSPDFEVEKQFTSGTCNAFIASLQPMGTKNLKQVLALGGNLNRLTNHLRLRYPLII